MFHLHYQQLVIYNEDNHVDEYSNHKYVDRSIFIVWIECNKKYSKARKLTYSGNSSKFVWDLQCRTYKPMKQGFAIRRITYVPSSLGEAYYLHVLLNIIKGPTSFEDIRTIKVILYSTFKDTCYTLDLFDDDKKYIDVIKEASIWVT